VTALKINDHCILWLIKLIAIVIFVATMISIPWEQLQGVEYTDRAVYIHHFLFEESIQDYKEFNGILDYILNETLWDSLVSTLVHNVGIPIDDVFQGIAILSLATASFFLIRYHNPLSLLLLINPLLVDLVFSQMRIALACSLLGIGVLIRNPVLFVILLSTAMFIHTATIIFIVVTIVALLAKRYMKNGISEKSVFIMLCIVGVIISLAISPALIVVILTAVGDRRAEYEDQASSILYSLFWLGLLILCGLKKKKILANILENEEACYSIIILSLVSFNILFGGYSTRFIAVSLPIIMCTMLNLSAAMERFLIIFIYAIYVSFQWIYWLNL
jgi:hypothetical protein